MIGWLIFGGIVLLVAFLLSLSVSLRFFYENDIDFKITYFIFTLYPVNKNKRKNKDKRSKKNKNKIKGENKNDSAEEEVKTDPEKELIKKAVSDKNTGKSNVKGSKKEKSAVEKMDIKMIRELIESLAHPFGRLLKKIRFNDICINAKIRADDAAAVAINYGLQSAAAGSLLAYIGSVAKVGVKEVNITPDFETYTDTGTETELCISCKIKIRLASLIVFAAVTFWRYFKNNFNKSNENKVSVSTKKSRTKKKPQDKNNL